MTARSTSTTRTRGERLADLRADSRDAFLGAFLDDERIFTTTRTNQSMLLRLRPVRDHREVRALADTARSRGLHRGRARSRCSTKPRRRRRVSRVAGRGARRRVASAGAAPTARDHGAAPLHVGHGAVLAAGWPVRDDPLRACRSRSPCRLPTSCSARAATIVAFGLVTGDQLTIGDGARVHGVRRPIAGPDRRHDRRPGSLLPGASVDATSRPTSELTVDGRRGPDLPDHERLDPGAPVRAPAGVGVLLGDRRDPRRRARRRAGQARSWCSATGSPIRRRPTTTPGSRPPSDRSASASARRPHG